MKSLDSVIHDARPSNKKRNEATHSGVTALNHKVTFHAEIMYTMFAFLILFQVSVKHFSVIQRCVYIFNTGLHACCYPFTLVLLTCTSWGKRPQLCSFLAIPYSGTVTGTLLHSGWMVFIVTGVQSWRHITIWTLKSVFRHWSAFRNTSKKPNLKHKNWCPTECTCILKEQYFTVKYIL